jgi:hypothetical protein
MTDFALAHPKSNSRQWELAGRAALAGVQDRTLIVRGVDFRSGGKPAFDFSSTAERV